MISIQSDTARLTFDPSVGNIPELVFSWAGRELVPLHRAAWTDEADALAANEVPLVDRKLAGDFVCAPFGQSDVEPAPPHGWTANSSWTVRQAAGAELFAELDRPVLGASISKAFRLSPDAPLLYQKHILRGGRGGLTFAHHPMVDVSGGARLSTSPKQTVLTNSFPIVPEHNALALSKALSDLTKVPASDGSSIDLTRLPIAEDAEDFAALVEAPNAKLGWTAVVRHRERDIVFVLKDPDQLPLTMVWHSNGARKDFPWSGRNRGVLGIEDGRAAGALGHAAALTESPFSAFGIPTAFDLAPGHEHTINHVIGAVPNSGDWERVEDISIVEDELVLSGDRGNAMRLPFRNAFFSS